MKTDYQHKEITSKDEKTKVITPGFDVLDEVVEKTESKPKVEYSFPAEGFSVMASSLPEAEAALEDFKKTKNN